MAILYSNPYIEIKQWSIQPSPSIVHGHNDCMCLIWVDRGQYRFDIGKTPYHLQSGQLLIEKPDFEYTLYGTGSNIYIFNFTTSFHQSIIEQYSLDVRHFWCNGHNAMTSLMNDNAIAEYWIYNIIHHIGLQANAHIIDAMILELVSKLLQPAEPAPMQHNMKENEAVAHAKDLMYRHFSEDITLTDIAAHCCLSPFHFSRIFKQYTSYSPIAFLNHIKLNHAIMMLRYSDEMIQHIAYACGFSSPEYFTSAFKLTYRMSPLEYRRKIKKPSPINGTA